MRLSMSMHDLHFRSPYLIDIDRQYFFKKQTALDVQTSKAYRKRQLGLKFVLISFALGSCITCTFFGLFFLSFNSACQVVLPLNSEFADRCLLRICRFYCGPGDRGQQAQAEIARRVRFDGEDRVASKPDWSDSSRFNFKYGKNLDRSSEIGLYGPWHHAEIARAASLFNWWELSGTRGCYHDVSGKGTGGEPDLTRERGVKRHQEFMNGI